MHLLSVLLCSQRLTLMPLLTPQISTVAFCATFNLISPVDCKLLSSLLSKGSSGCHSQQLFKLPRLPSLSSLLCRPSYNSYMHSYCGSTGTGDYGFSNGGSSYPSYPAMSGKSSHKDLLTSFNCQINYAARLPQSHRIHRMGLLSPVTSHGQMAPSRHLIPRHPFSRLLSLVVQVAQKSGAILTYEALVTTPLLLKLHLNHPSNSNRYNKSTANCPLVTMITIVTLSATFIPRTVVE